LVFKNGKRPGLVDDLKSALLVLEGNLKHLCTVEGLDEVRFEGRNEKLGLCGKLFDQSGYCATVLAV
jgi:hypothetical protein